ncbi:hypothetical protein SKAU_G00420100 [Synaphobranchus kaupii]|uniref:A20-type domain-containing protein n=1 Tax=Synaphobranchus kaupii TaxID=118154 RepID=A0A9Q1E6G7_SYNKA|nr:hypothetical protein SKAU_G00420100 [Synaphobranchus kaupii]
MTAKGEKRVEYSRPDQPNRSLSHRPPSQQPAQHVKMEERRRLPLSLEESNRTKALTVCQRISKDIVCPRLTGPRVYHLREMHQYSVHLSDYVPGAKRGDLVADSLFDLQLQRELEESGALNWNWCKRGRSLHALKNAGQSNGLLDALSVCMWGVSDSDMAMRTALYNTMVGSSPADLRLASHEERNPAGLLVISEDWWEAVMLARPRAGDAKSGDSPYQRIHLFVLANIIRRPIIVVGGSTDQGAETPVDSASNPGPQGIYIPWLWAGAECYPYPVVLGTSSPWRRFVPLVTAGSAQGDEDGVALPLVWGVPRGQQELPLHFPPDGDERSALSRLGDYLKLQTLTLGQRTAYGARLKGHNLSVPLSLVEDYFELANHPRSQLTQDVRESGREERNGGLSPSACPSSSSSSSRSTDFSITEHKCVTEHCHYFSSKNTWPLCHCCYGNQQQHQPHLQSRNCPLKGRGISSSEGSLCGDTPPRLRDLDYRPPGVRVGGAERNDFLCGRCQACKMEIRTFNGFCFSCLKRQTDTPLDPDLPAPPPPDPDPPARPAETAWASPDRDESTEGQSCLTSGCVYFGTAKHAGYCTVCYCTQTETPTHSPPPAPPPSSSSTSSSSSSHPLQLSSNLRNLPSCSAPGCIMLGNPAFRGLCDRCFLAHHRGAIEIQASEAMPVSQGSDGVSRKYHWLQSTPDPPSTGTEEVITPHIERPSSSCLLGNSQALPGPNRTKHCLGSGCTNFGNSRCKGFCNSCYKNHI